MPRRGGVIRCYFPRRMVGGHEHCWLFSQLADPKRDYLWQRFTPKDGELHGINNPKRPSHSATLYVLGNLWTSTSVARGSNARRLQVTGGYHFLPTLLSPSSKQVMEGYYDFPRQLVHRSLSCCVGQPENQLPTRAPLFGLEAAARRSITKYVPSLTAPNVRCLPLHPPSLWPDKARVRQDRLRHSTICLSKTPFCLLPTFVTTLAATRWSFFACVQRLPASRGYQPPIAP
jgi:hypothetical protein